MSGIRHMRAVMVAGLVGCAIAAAVTSPAAASPDLGPIHYCRGTFDVDGVPYGFLGRGVSCPVIKGWSRRIQAGWRGPAGWKCFPYGYEGGDCRRVKPPKQGAHFEWYAAD